MGDAVLDHGAELEALHDAVWESYQTTYAGNPVDTARLRRKLTPNEWVMVQAAMQSGKFIVQPINCSMGFGFGLSLYAIPADPPYPLVPRDRPKLLLTLEGDHLPEGFEESFDVAWDIMSPFSHNEANGVRLREYLGEELQKKSHYDY